MRRYVHYGMLTLAHYLFSNPCCYTQNPDAFKHRKRPKHG